MSADNWAICPRCQSGQRVHVADLQRTADGAYGTVSVQEFDAMRSAAEEAAKVELKATFREDYEIGAYDDGMLYISYSGSCSVCGLSAEFKHEERFYSAPVDPQRSEK